MSNSTTILSIMSLFVGAFFLSIFINRNRDKKPRRIIIDDSILEPYSHIHNLDCDYELVGSGVSQIVSEEPRIINLKDYANSIINAKENQN